MWRRWTQTTHRNQETRYNTDMNDTTKQVNAADETIHDLAKVTVEELPYDGGGWPGDGSGMDDFEDYNQNEGYDF